MRIQWMFALLMAGVAMAASAEEGKFQRVEAVPFNQVRVEDKFWSPRFETNRKATVWYDFRKCEETGRIKNFAVAGGLEQGEFEGIPYNDSDVYKVIEGAAYTLATHPDRKLEQYLDDLIVKIAAAQEPDGYLYTARTIIKDGAKMPKMSGPARWSNLRSSHELYNVGHLYEAAVAYWQATGKRALLDVAIKNADLIDRTFGPEKEKLKYPPGHEEIEIGLVKLYQATENEKYLKLAKFFIDTRGRAEGHTLYGEYAQDHVPLAQQDKPVGHAVRAGYLYAGAADVAALTGDGALLAALDRIWGNVVGRKLYLTGGIGARRAGEAFGDDFELPNKTAYNETCAAIANALWNHRMFLVRGEAKYIDVLERVIYNGFLSGVHMNGELFFYPNPLESDPGYTRQPWFGTSCCPVNVVRFIPSIAGYVYATKRDAIFVNLFIGGEGKIKLGGQTVAIRQETNYPWDGKVKMTVKPERAGEFELRVRVPGWALERPVPSDLYRYVGGMRDAAVNFTVNGEVAVAKVVNGYAQFRREWKAGDTLEVTWPMEARRVLADQNVKDDAGRVAIERGPLVYCAEGVDNGDVVSNLVLADQSGIKEEFKRDLLGGVMTLKSKATALTRNDKGVVTERPAELTLVPYYAWCHRGAGAMTVWLARTSEAAKPLAAPTLASTSKATASHVFGQDSLAALNDLVEPEKSGDHSVPRFTWWDHKGTGEWAQYEFKEAKTIKGVEVYWFDDTGRGSCRVPQSWRVMVKTGGAWKPAEDASEGGVALDKFNRVTFKPVKAEGLRIEVQLQPKFSGGVLEWKVLE